MDLGNMTVDNIAQRIWNSDGRDGEGLRYPATVSIWARWIFLAACLIEVNYRIEYGALSHILNALYVLALMFRRLGHVEGSLHRPGGPALAAAPQRD